MHRDEITNGLNKLNGVIPGGDTCMHLGLEKVCSRDCLCLQLYPTILKCSIKWYFSITGKRANLSWKLW